MVLGEQYLKEGCKSKLYLKTSEDTDRTSTIAFDLIERAPKLLNFERLALFAGTLLRVNLGS